jgi:hypothetical protein
MLMRVQATHISLANKVFDRGIQKLDVGINDIVSVLDEDTYEYDLQKTSMCVSSSKNYRYNFSAEKVMHRTFEITNKIKGKSYVGAVHKYFVHTTYAKMENLCTSLSRWKKLRTR